MFLNKKIFKVIFKKAFDIYFFLKKTLKRLSNILKISKVFPATLFYSYYPSFTFILFQFFIKVSHHQTDSK